MVDGFDRRDLESALTTTFSARAFTDADVDDATVARVLNRARFAPSGGNRQGWRVLVIRDAETRRLFADLATPPMRAYVAQTLAGETPFNPVVPTSVDIAAAAASDLDVSRVIDPITEAPVLLLVVVDLSLVVAFDSGLDRIAIAPGASIFPFVWNILLSARLEGLAGVITTYLHPSEPEVFSSLGIPDGHAIAALVPLGVPDKWLTRLSRRPVEDFAVLERWDGKRLAVDTES